MADFNKRVKLFGANDAVPRRVKSIMELVKDCLSDFMLQVLIVAAIVSLAVGVAQDGFSGILDGVSIMVAILIITVITVGNNSVKEK